MKSHEAEGVRASAPHTPNGRSIAATLPTLFHVENLSNLAPLFAVPGKQSARLPGGKLRHGARFVEETPIDDLNTSLLCFGPRDKVPPADSALGYAVLPLPAVQEATNEKGAQ